jgi:hypothetical protein
MMTGCSPVELGGMVEPHLAIGETNARTAVPRAGVREMTPPISADTLVTVTGGLGLREVLAYMRENQALARTFDARIAAARETGSHVGVELEDLVGGNFYKTEAARWAATARRMQKSK